MPAIKGKDGVLTVEGTAVAQVTAYSLTETAETAETTSFDSTNGFKTHVPTLKSWEGSCDLVYNEQEMTDVDLVPGGDATGDPKALILYPAGSGTSNYAGDIIITSMEITGETADVVSATINFTGTGVLTRTQV